MLSELFNLVFDQLAPRWLQWVVYGTLAGAVLLLFAYLIWNRQF